MSFQTIHTDYGLARLAEAEASGSASAQAGLSVEIAGLWMPPYVWDSVTVDAMAMLTVEAP